MSDSGINATANVTDDATSVKGGSTQNAFCVDLEEWFHICGVQTEYSDPQSWDTAASHVVADTEVLMRLLDEADTRGTFLTVGWVAQRYPDLIRRLADAGHEIGCHTYFHNLVFAQTPAAFEEDLVRCLDVLRSLSGQSVNTFRAPGFSITGDALWAYPILRKHGITIDVSIVPARRDHGGIAGFPRDPFRISMDEGEISCFPVPVMTILGRRIPFSGGGYLRLFPKWLVDYGFRQNRRANRQGMLYIHPREINPHQPRLRLPRVKYFKYYVNLRTTEDKLRHLLRTYRFGTVTETVGGISSWPARTLADLTQNAKWRPRQPR